MKLIDLFRRKHPAPIPIPPRPLPARQKQLPIFWPPNETARRCLWQSPLRLSLLPA